MHLLPPKVRFILAPFALGPPLPSNATPESLPAWRRVFPRALPTVDPMLKPLFQFTKKVVVSVTAEGVYKAMTAETRARVDAAKTPEEWHQAATNHAMADRIGTWLSETARDHLANIIKEEEGIE